MFDQLSLHERLLKALDELKFSTPTPVQEAVIPRVLDGVDLCVSAPTGSGKSAAFLLPILHSFLEKAAPNAGTRALILAPTRELAAQIEQSCKALASYTRIECLSVCGGENYQNQAAKMRKNPEIIIATPGRIKEHLERNNIDFYDLEFLVLDEADRMLDLGLRDEVLEVVKTCRVERQTLLFSATLSHQGLSSIIAEIQHEPESIDLGQDNDEKPDIRQLLVLSDDVELKQKQTAWLLKNRVYQQAIVFCNTRVMTEELGAFLRQQQLKVGVLHGEMSQPERERIMQLLRDGRINVLVATEVAARGLDVTHIELVINFDLAYNPEEHLHRCGRTGRAGRSGEAITLLTSREWNRKATIENVLKFQFEPLSLPGGLTARYTGPKKVKSSGKAAATSKRKKDDKKGNSSKSKQRARDRKQVGKRRKPAAPSTISEDGMAPLKKR